VGHGRRKNHLDFGGHQDSFMDCGLSSRIFSIIRCVFFYAAYGIIDNDDRAYHDQFCHLPSANELMYSTQSCWWRSITPANFPYPALG